MKLAVLPALVLLACSYAAAAPADAPTAVLPADMEIHLELAETLSSHTAKKGEPVRFRTVGDTTVGGVLVVPDGTEADGVVVDAKRKGHLGHAGLLDVDVQFLRLPHGFRVPVNGALEQEGNGHGTRTGVLVGATSAVFLPAAPLFLLMHGADVVLTAGTPVTAFVYHTITVPLPAK